MAKKQSFGEKTLKAKQAGKSMAKIVLAEKKANGEFRYRDKMVRADQVQDEIKAARAA